MIVSEKNIREEIIKSAAYHLLITARTAPKAKGEDSLEILLIDGNEKRKLAEAMVEMGDRHKDFVRDAKGVEVAEAVMLVGVFGDKTLGLNCGACGFKDCNGLKKADRVTGNDFSGPNCAYKLIDLGIALGSAAKLAAIIGIDNRVMYRVGAAAKRLGFANSDVVLGIPLTSAAKNPFFDRKKDEGA
jgi:uncharacterized ferredoxin-like protein